MRVHRNTWGRVSQAWKRVWKRENEVWNLCNIWDIQHGCRPMRRRIKAVLLHMCSGFPTEILEQMIVTSLYDVTRVSHATRGGNYKRRVWPGLGGCCYYCHLGVLTSIWVFTKAQTLYFGCLGAPRVGSISWMYSVVCFSISMHPDLFGGLWVIVTYLVVTGLTTTSSPWT